MNKILKERIDYILARMVMTENARRGIDELLSLFEEMGNEVCEDCKKKVEAFIK